MAYIYHAFGIMEETHVNAPAVLVTPRGATWKDIAPMRDDSHINSLDNQIPYGFCKCGCGTETTIQDDGRPARFVLGHARKLSARYRRSGDFKVCTACNQRLHVSKFRRTLGTSDRLTSACKSCNRIEQQNRSARDRGDMSTLSPRDWQDVLDEVGGACVNCGSTIDLHIDHIVPVSLGGKNVKSNIQPLCRHCNSRKRDHRTDYRNSRYRNAPLPLDD